MKDFCLKNSSRSLIICKKSFSVLQVVELVSNIQTILIRSNKSIKDSGAFSVNYLLVQKTKLSSDDDIAHTDFILFFYLLKFCFITK